MFLASISLLSWLPTLRKQLCIAQPAECESLSRLSDKFAPLLMIATRHFSFPSDMTGDSIVQEGAAFALECRLNTLNPTIKGVTYDVGPANIRFKFRNEVITERVEVINGTAARLNIPRASLDDSGYYYCFLDVPGAGNMTLVCSNHLRVGCKCLATAVVPFHVSQVLYSRRLLMRPVYVYFLLAHLLYRRA